MRKGKGVYLDSACQSLRPDSVIKAITEYYEEYPACGGRSVHNMSSKVSVVIDETREKLADFFGTDDPDSYIFTKNCTEGINTVAFGLGLKKGDAVVTSDTEHNSNHVPWMFLSENAGVKRRYSGSGRGGEFDIENFKKCLGKDVRIVSVQHAGNVTGCILPIKEITEIAHDNGSLVLVDGAQAAPHMKVDLKNLDVDFYCLSVHKMLGPSGMGVMYGKKDALEKLRPLCVGGGTVGLTTYEHVDLAPVPDRFEAGLQNYSGIAGTKAALEYLDNVGLDEIKAQDDRLMRMLFEKTEDIKGLRIVGPEDPARRIGVFSFNIDGLGSHDVAMMVDNIDGIMIRSGMHCAHPYYMSRDIDGSARASVYLYNNEQDIDRFADALKKVAETFGDH
jgi:cysteine desulfurase/selenocysteine lyase